MIAYYIREVFSYIPVVMLWIAFLYMLAIFKHPDVIADLLSEDRPWVRKTMCTLIFIVFAVVFLAGFGQLMKGTPPMEDWHEFFSYFGFGVPWLFGAGLTGCYMVSVGLVAAAEVENKREEERQSKWKRESNFEQ